MSNTQWGHRLRLWYGNEQQGESVLVISKNNYYPNVSEVHALHIREKRKNVRPDGVKQEGNLADKNPLSHLAK